VSTFEEQCRERDEKERRAVEIDTELERTRKFFMQTVNGYRSTLAVETGMAMVLSSPFTLGEGLPTTRAGWLRLTCHLVVLLFMFHKAHTFFEARLRRDGL
jgi:uncharacterized membrane protein